MTSKFPAPEERARLMPPWVAIGFGLGVAAGLALLLPQREQEDLLARAPAPEDPVRKAVLQALGQVPPAPTAVARAPGAPPADGAQYPPLDAEEAWRALEAARTTVQQRRAFARAVQFLLAQGAPLRAFDEAQRHLGALRHDALTLDLMTALAQSADLPLRAQDYAGAALAASAGDDPLRPLRQQRAYDLSLAAGRLADAQALAAQALARPIAAADERAWRLRLARIAAWTDQPALALAQWQAMARTSGAPADQALADWREAARLARALGDTPAFIEALQAQRRLAPQEVAGDPARAQELELALEQQGDIAGARRLLQEELARAPQAQRGATLRRLADLALRAGDDTLAADSLQRLLDARPGDATLALELARLRARHGAGAEAARLVQAHVDLAQESDAGRLRDAARLLREGGLLDEAAAADRRLIGLGRADNGTRLEAIALLELRAPLQAADLAARLFRATPDADLGQRALTLLERYADAAAVRAFLAGFTPAMESAVAGNAYFLVQRAQSRLRLGQAQAAVHDAQRALALRPHDAHFRAAYLWTLIAARAAEPLRVQVARWAPLLAPGRHPAPDLADAMVAGMLAVHEPELALPFVQRRASASAQPLWWLAYADALEQSGREELARRAQWRALALLRAQPAAAPADAAARAQALERLNLALSYVQGDVARARLRALADRVRLGAHAPGADGLSDEQRALLLSASVERAPDTLGAAWLLALYGRLGLADDDAGWARLSVALAQDDRSGLARLLDDQAQWLPPAEAAEAAQRLGRYNQAQSLAFEQLERAPASDALAAQWRQSVGGVLADTPSFQSAGAEAGLRSFAQDPLREFAQWLAAGVPLTQHLALGVRADVAQRSSSDERQFLAPAAADRSLTASVRGRSDGAGEWQIDLGERDALRHVDALAAQWQQAPLAGLQIDARVAWHQATADSVFLRAGGMRDQLALGAQQRWSATDLAALGLQRNDYRSQSGAEVGMGSVTRLDLVHDLRLAYPDLSVFASGADLRFQARGGLDPTLATLLPPALRVGATNGAFLPQSTRQFELGVQAGVSARGELPHAVRPYARLGFLQDQVAGGSPQWEAGVVGDAFGGDAWSLSYQGGRAIGSGLTAPQREWILRYRWLF